MCYPPRSTGTVRHGQHTTRCGTGPSSSPSPCRPLLGAGLHLFSRPRPRLPIPSRRRCSNALHDYDDGTRPLHGLPQAPRRMAVLMRWCTSRPSMRQSTDHPFSNQRSARQQWKAMASCAADHLPPKLLCKNFVCQTKLGRLGFRVLIADVWRTAAVMAGAASERSKYERSI